VFLSAFRKIFNGPQYLGKKTFTYYIPAPPQRKVGYQEKEFDHIFAHLMEKGFDIIDIKIQSVSSNSTVGVWIVCLLGALTEEALKEDLNIEYTVVAAQRDQEIKLDPSIEHEC
jgi:hypothetical protein